MAGRRDITGPHEELIAIGHELVEMGANPVDVERCFGDHLPRSLEGIMMDASLIGLELT